MPIDFSSPASGYLTGQLLVATPLIHDGCFKQAVVYVCEHDAGGAMGIIINHPITSIRLGAVLQELNLNSEGEVGDLPVYFGGPVESHRGFVLHTDDVMIEETIRGEGGIALSANIAMLRNMAAGTGPEKAFLVLGYAGWGAHQLEAEIESGSWINVSATRELVFNADNEMKWAATAATLGVDMQRLSMTVGHA